MSYDDRKKSKLRTDKYDNKSSSSYYGKSASRSRYDEHDDRDDYYTSKKVKSKSRSRSRSPARSKIITAKSLNADIMPTVKPNGKPSSLAKFGFNGIIEKKFNPGTPSRTIMMRQLPLEMDDAELKNEFTMLMIPFKDIRLVKNRDTGTSRGFAFIEFGTIEEAQAWMNSTQGWLMFSNYDNKIQLFYSHSTADEANSINSRKGSILNTDWDCSKCGIKNFKRRDKCFKCGITREDSEKRKDGEGYEFAGSSPCNTLLLRGLDALTTSDTIIKVFNQYSNYNLPVKNCYIAKDIHTNVSNGFAFVEMNSIQDAGYMIQLVGAYIEIDGKQVVINYCNNSYRTAITIFEDKSKKGLYDNPSENSMYVINTHVNNKTNQTDQANSAAAVAQAALKSMQKKQELLSHITSAFKQDAIIPTGTDLDSSVNANLQYIAQQVDMVSNKVYQPPDVTQFTYDETSGYYYDYTTGFYYDASSQYYFNSLTQQYMYWDPSQSTYVPVPSATSTTTTNMDTSSTTSNQNPAETEKNAESTEQVIDTSKTVKSSNKPKTAAQIAKDMERWAKEQAKKKETLAKKTSSTPQTIQTKVQVEVKPVETIASFNQIGTKVSQSKDETAVIINDASLNKKLIEREIEAVSDNRNESQTNKEIHNALDESILIDSAKMACLLCKRKFDSIDILNKHVAKSDLHKTNLEKWRKENLSNGTGQSKNEKSQEELDSLQAALQYRDRAKERRDKFGLPEPPSPTYVAPKPKYNDDHQPLTNVSFSAANTDSVASKMMRKMGWTEGVGIGKNLQGISAPIEATMRQKGSGLGASNLQIDPNDSYQVAVRKSAKARFEQLS